MTLYRRALVGLWFLAPAAASAQCGGEERWAVKMGADASAAALLAASPIGASLHDLVHIPRPALPNDETTRTSAEREVRALDAYLVKFKKEAGKTGDQDYHLVVSDGTLLYSKGGSGAASSHSVIAEIPDPLCVAGRNGTVPGPSHLAASLAQVRTAFETQFPDAAGGWNDAGGIPVRITGVVFFDRPHGQVGRALNGLELHPLLRIEFNPSVPPSTEPGTGVPLSTVSVVAIENAGFEDGVQGWHASDGVVVSGGAMAARSGMGKAWLGGHGEKRSDHAWQRVTLPSDADAIAASFYLHVETDEDADTPYDFLRVRVRTSSGSLLATLATFSNVDTNSGFRRRTVDLTAFRGQSVRVSFESSEDMASSTSFVIDDVRIVSERHP